MSRLSQRLAADLRSGDAALPQFAGTKQQLVVLELEFERRKPQRILDVQGSIWSFDNQGKADASLWEEHCARINLLPGALGDLPTGVADVRPVIARRKLDAETRWVVADEVLQLIADDLRRHG